MVTGASEIRRAALRLMVEALDDVASPGDRLPIQFLMRQHLLETREPPLDGERGERWLQVLQAQLSPRRIGPLQWPLTEVLATCHDLPLSRGDFTAWLLEELERL